MSNWRSNQPTKMTASPKWRVGVVTARFNQNITGELKSGALKRLQEMGLKEKQIVCVDVPGAVEIPLAAQWLFKSGIDGVITLGCVIRGETPHFDYVCQAVERGCTHLQLQESRPVVFGVLTTENEKQALDRIGGKHGHKGRDAADVLVEMLNLKLKIKKNKKGE